MWEISSGVLVFVSHCTKTKTNKKQKILLNAEEFVVMKLLVGWELKLLSIPSKILKLNFSRS